MAVASAGIRLLAAALLVLMVTRRSVGEVLPENVALSTSSEPAQQRPGLPNLHLLPTDVCGADFGLKDLGGSQTALGEFPWLARLEFIQAASEGRIVGDHPLFACSGALISSKYVLTSAYCTGNARYQLARVRLGEHRNSTSPDCSPGPLTGERTCAEPAVDYFVESLSVHPEYSSTDDNHYNDIGLVRLMLTVQFNDFVKPICLPMTLDVATGNPLSLWVSGWAKQNAWAESDVKLKESVPFVSIGNCSTSYRGIGVELNETRQMCAGGRGHADSCVGDSGGPLMSADATAAAGVRWHVVGVACFGPATCGGYPAAYTRVAHYVPWILETIRGLGAPVRRGNNSTL